MKAKYFCLIFLIFFFVFAPFNNAKALCIGDASCGNHILMQSLNSIVNFATLKYPAGYRNCDSGDLECIKDKDEVWGFDLEPNHEPLFFPDSDSMTVKFMGIEQSVDIGSCTEIGIPHVASMKICAEDRGSDVICAIIKQNTAINEFEEAAAKIEDDKADYAAKAGTAPVKFVFSSYDYINMELGCYYKKPFKGVQPLCIDQNTMQRTYGNIDNDPTQPIYNADQYSRSGSDLCSPYMSTTCYTWWRYDSDLGPSKFNGHPYRIYVTGDGSEDNPASLFGSEYTGEFINSNMHIAGPITDCIIGTIKSVFYYKDPYSASNNFKSGKIAINYIQDGMRKFTMTALVLFIIFFAMRVMLTPQEPQKADIFIHIMKIVLVLYIGLGSFTEEYFGLIIDSSVALAGIIINAAADTNYASVCNELALVSDGSLPYERGIALWDTLDCKFFSYLGFGQFNGAIILMILASSFFAFPLGIFLFLILLYVIMMMIGMFISTVQIFIFAIMSLGIIIFLAPIVAPFLLFKFGGLSQVFQKWLSTLLQFSIYPIVGCAYMALMIASYDYVMYGDTVIPASGWINPEDCDDTAFMCIITKIIHENNFGTLSLPLLSDIPILTYGENFFALFKSSLWLLIFTYLFSKLSGEILGLSSQLTGSIMLDLGRIGLANKAISGAMDKVTGKISEAAEKGAAKSMGIDEKSKEKKAARRENLEKTLKGDKK